MPVSRTYSILHEEPSSPGIMLNRFLGAEALPQRDLPMEESPKKTGILNIDVHETESLTTTEFFADMKVDHSEIDSMYEACGALIEEGFVLQHDEDFEELDELDWSAPVLDTSSLSSSPTATPQMSPRGNAFDVETGLPIPPYLLSRGGPPTSDPSRPFHIALDFSPEGYIHSDPTRPNPHIQYRCEWDRSCFKRLRGSSPGYIQCHLRQVHQVPDNTEKLIRCQHFMHEENRICGAMVLAKQMGTHVCDVHWKSRIVRCPFCGHWQISRVEMRSHWTECRRYKSSSEGDRRNWGQYWKWTAKKWSLAQ